MKEFCLGWFFILGTVLFYSVLIVTSPIWGSFLVYEYFAKS